MYDTSLLYWNARDRAKLRLKPIFVCRTCGKKVERTQGTKVLKGLLKLDTPHSLVYSAYYEQDISAKKEEEGQNPWLS